MPYTDNKTDDMVEKAFTYNIDMAVNDMTVKFLGKAGNRKTSRHTVTMRIPILHVHMSISTLIGCARVQITMLC